MTGDGIDWKAEADDSDEYLSLLSEVASWAHELVALGVGNSTKRDHYEKRKAAFAGLKKALDELTTWEDKYLDVHQ